MKGFSIDPFCGPHPDDNFCLVMVICNCGNNILTDPATIGTAFRHRVDAGLGDSKLLYCGDCGMRFHVRRQESHFHVDEEREDIYDVQTLDGGKFGDYLNTYAGIAMDLKNRSFPTSYDLNQLLQETPIISISEKYKDNPEMQKALKAHPKKVRRLNKLSTHVDSGITKFMRITNEVTRLVRGKNAELFFLDPKFNPDFVFYKP